MKQRTIGNNSIGAIGLGCMGMSWAYGSPNNEESLRVFDRALELGVNHWDTADLYGAGENEKLLAEALKGRRDKVFLATKFGNVFDKSLTTHQDLVESGAWIVDGTASYARKCIENSLQRLEVDHVDLYYLHRVDGRTPIEETVGAMAEFVKEGKVRHLGLSEVSPETLRRAHAVHPIAAVQNEYSLWTRDYETTTLEACKELGIAFVPYSPLGRGFLTGEIKSFDDLPEGDWRRTNPRFQPENFAQNLEIVERVKAIAVKHGATNAQIALAWVLAMGDHICPIPGTKRVKYIEDNAGADAVTLSGADLEELSSIFAPAGTRYAEAMMASLAR